MFNTNELKMGTTLALDVKLPLNQTNPFWLGDVQLYVSIPSGGVYNAWLGRQPPTGLTTGAWHTLTFGLPGNVQTALASPHIDAQLLIAFNTGNCAEAALIDNVQTLA